MLLWNCNELSRNFICVCVYILPNTACLYLGFISSFIIFSLPVVVQSEKKVKMKVLVPQSCLAFYNPMNCSSSGSSSIEFCRQEYWSGQAFPSPRDLSDPGIQPRSPPLQADSLLAEPLGRTLNTSIAEKHFWNSVCNILVKIYIP